MQGEDDSQINLLSPQGKTRNESKEDQQPHHRANAVSMFTDNGVMKQQFKKQNPNGVSFGARTSNTV